MGSLLRTGAASSRKLPTSGQALSLLGVYKHIMCTHVPVCAFIAKMKMKTAYLCSQEFEVELSGAESRALDLLDSETSWVRWVPGDDSTLSPVSEALVDAPAASDAGPWQRQADDCLVWMMILAIPPEPCPLCACPFPSRSPPEQLAILLINIGLFCCASGAQAKDTISA